MKTSKVHQVYKRTRDLCQEFDVSSVTIWRWVRDGRLPEPKKINGQNIWPADVTVKFDKGVA